MRGYTNLRGNAKPRCCFYQKTILRHFSLVLAFQACGLVINEVLKMKIILTLISTFTLMITASYAVASDFYVTTVKSCPDGLEIQRFDSWESGNHKTGFFMMISGNALQSLSGQLGPRSNSSDLSHFEVGSSRWGEFVGSVSSGNVFAREIDNGKTVIFSIMNSNGQELANYYFNNCN